MAALIKKHGLVDEDIRLISCHTAKVIPKGFLRSV